MIHCENDALVTDATERLVASGRTTWAYHGQARPPEAEVEAIRRVLYLAQVAGAAVYIVHCSTAESIRVVARGDALLTPSAAPTTSVNSRTLDRAGSGHTAR